jgi:hypothetical protein
MSDIAGIAGVVDVAGAAAPRGAGRVVGLVAGRLAGRQATSAMITNAKYLQDVAEGTGNARLGVDGDREGQGVTIRSRPPRGNGSVD